MNLMLWVVYPYLCLASFAIGHFWRYRVDQFGWTTRSSQLYERKLLRMGSLLFYFGALAAIGGHVLGLIVPEGVTAFFGVTETMYHLVSVGAGTVAGSACLLGFAVLVYRRLAVRRVALVTSRMDVVTYVMLGLVMMLGMLETVGVNLLGGGYDYRGTVSVWFRDLFLLNPQPMLMASAPHLYQIHALAAFALFAIWPYTRLVHVWSLPFDYLWRPTIVYRSRNGVPLAKEGRPS